jgi:glutathione S-transferase
MIQQPTIRLYDSQTSPNCHRVKIVLEEKQLPYEKQENKRTRFSSTRSVWKGAVIIDGETVLYESCFINEYLEERYPDPPLMNHGHSDD